METGNRVNVLFEAADSLLDHTDIKKSHMSILYKEDGLSFCLLNKEKNKYIVLGHYSLEADVEQNLLFEFLDRFDQIPGSVSLAVVDQNFCMVPKSLFIAEQAAEYLKFSQNQGALKTAYTSIGNNVLIYQEVQQNFEFLKQRIPHLRVLNNAEVALRYYDSYKSVDNSYFIVNFNNNILETTVIKDGQLEVHNVFITETEEDCSYYILSLFEQLKLNPLTVPLHLSGTISKKSDLVQSLKQFIKELKWELRPASYQYSYTFNTQEEHFNNRLFQQHLCVL